MYPKKHDSDINFAIWLLGGAREQKIAWKCPFKWISKRTTKNCENFEYFKQITEVMRVLSFEWLGFHDLNMTESDTRPDLENLKFSDLHENLSPG